MMKKILLTLALVSSGLTADNKEGININNNNILNFNFEANIILAKLGNALKNLGTQCSQVLKKPTMYGMQSLNWITENKFKSCCVVAITTFASIQLHAWYLSKMLNRNSWWSLWRSEKLHEDIFNMSPNMLAQELLVEIQRRYTTLETITDSVTPLMKFMKDVECEEKKLKDYLRFCMLMDKLYLTAYSLVNHELKKQYIDRLRRLTHVRNIFLNWVSEYKLNTPLTTSQTKKYKIFTNIDDFITYCV